MASPNFIENLELQLSEIQLLDSMFPGDGEFCLDDPSVLSDVQTFVDDSAESTCVADQGISGNSGKGSTGGSTDASQKRIRQLSFSIKISINDHQNRNVSLSFLFLFLSKDQ